MEEANNRDRQVEELLRTDFSTEERSKEVIRERLLLKLQHQQKEGKDRREAPRVKGWLPHRLLKPAFLVALIMMFLGSFAMTSYAQDFYQAVKAVFVGNHAKYLLWDGTDTGSKPNQTSEQNNAKTDIENLDKGKSYLAFDFLLPSYLPEGYSYSRMALFKDEQGRLSKESEYALIYFSNGEADKDISMQLRLMNEDTAFEGDLADAEGIKINGHEAVKGRGNVAVEIDGVLYMFRSRSSGIPDGELLKMAESL